MAVATNGERTALGQSRQPELAHCHIMRYICILFILFCIDLLCATGTALIKVTDDVADDGSQSMPPSLSPPFCSRNGSKKKVHLQLEHTAPVSRHHTTFPGVIDQLVGEIPYDRLEIHLTRGRWDYASWRTVSWLPKPTGAELHASFPANVSSHNLDQHWLSLTHALSGLLCASLNLLGKSSMVASPQLRLQHLLLQPSKPQSSRDLYAALPAEAVCTENLTPWLKLLPCRDQAGLASLLRDRQRLFGSEYHSLSLQVYPVRHPSTHVALGMRLVQTATMVLLAGARGAAAGPSDDPAAATLAMVLENTPIHACPVAHSSSLYVGTYQSSHEGLSLVAHDMQPCDGSTRCLAAVRLPPTPHKQQPSAAPSAKPLLSVHRFLTGAGMLHGKMVLAVHRQVVPRQLSNLQREAVQGRVCAADVLCIFQVVPWHVCMWLHTLQLRLDGQVVQLDRHVIACHVQPAVDRQSPLVLELCLHVPASTTAITISADFSKAFLSVSEHPPDAHRGFDVPAALVTYAWPAPATSLLSSNAEGQSNHFIFGEDHSVDDCSSGSNSSGSSSSGSLSFETGDGLSSSLLSMLCAPGAVQQVYSEGLLVQLATPDFSMPYNVICLTSTVLAVFVGATLNTLMARHKPTVASSK